MCDTCGCGETTQITINRPGQSSNPKPASHDHAPGKTRIAVEIDVLSANNARAGRNRVWFRKLDLTVFNLMSSPGSGKTTLLERTVADLGRYTWLVIEGDQQTDLDAERLDRAGAEAVQINTGTGCHLDAQMVHDAVHELNPTAGGILAIENVGNLVCPALFDLGEAARVVIVSTTEGADKPLKYPTILRDADLCLVNKIDLLPYVDFKMDLFRSNILKINPAINILPVSATSGEGLDAWYRWIDSQVQAGQVAATIPGAQSGA